VWFVVGDSSVSLYLLVPQNGYLGSLTFSYLFIIIIIITIIFIISAAAVAVKKL
jgi:hypothetical protein